MSAPTPEQIRYFQEHGSDNRQGELYATAICTLILAWSFVILRFASRWNIRAGFKTDDWLIVGAAATFTAFPIGMFVLVDVGFGKHIIFVTDPQRMVEMVVLCEIAYSLTIPLTKFSILSLYNRIFPSVALMRASIAIAIITALYSTALAVVCILQCVPLSTLWESSGGWCMNTTIPYTITAVANVVTDIAVLCLPMPFLYRLNMRKGRKLQLMALFALGGCVCVFGVVRSIEVGTASPVDQSWSTVNGTIWSAVEPCVGIVSACLPTMRGLIQRGRGSRSAYPGAGAREGGHGFRQLGWTVSRRKSPHSSMGLGRSGGGGSGGAGDSSDVSTKPRVWSTVTSGLQSSADRSRLGADVEEHPFAQLDSEGRSDGRMTPGMDTMTMDDDGPVTMPGAGRRSNDIHVRTEMTQEVSSALRP